MKRLGLALIALLSLTAAANAQSTVKAIGTIVPGDCVEWFSQTQIQDSGTNCGGQPVTAITALTGDVTAAGPGSVPATLATVNSSPGTVGSSTAIPVLTINGKGLVTAQTTAAVVAPAGTLTGTTLAAGITASSLTSFGNAPTIVSPVINGTPTGPGAYITIYSTNCQLATSCSLPAIPAAAGTLTGTTLNPTVVTSSLTTVGTIGTGVWQGTLVGLAYGGTNAALTPNAGGMVYSTASALAIVNNPNSNGECLLSGTSAPTWGSCAGAAAGVTSLGNVAADTTLAIAGTGIGPWNGNVTIALNLGNANTWTGAQTFTNGDLLLKGSSSGAMTLEAPAAASTYIITFPAATDTVSVLGTAQTFTAAKTYTNSDLLLLGSSTGYTTFFSANSGGSNYTLTIPAATDTMAVLGQNQTFSGTETFSGTLNVSGTFELGGNAISTSAALAITAGTTGQLAVWTSGTAIGGANLAVATTAPTNPSATTSAAGLMMGIGGGTGACTLTPVTGKKIEITVDGYIQQSTSGAQVHLAGLRYGSGTAPANGVALTGTVTGNTGRAYFLAASAGQYAPFSVSGIATGLTAGVAYWFDVGLAVTTGTGTIGNLTCTMREII